MGLYTKHTVNFGQFEKYISRLFTSGAIKGRIIVLKSGSLRPLKICAKGYYKLRTLRKGKSLVKKRTLMP